MNALASTRPGHVVCVGQAVLDRIYVVQKIPAVPGKARALDMLEVGGGIASNASVAIARLGSPVALWARVGDDVAGHKVIDQLAKEKVDVRHVRSLPNARSSSSVVIVESSGERLIVNDPGLGLDTDPSWLPTATLAADQVQCVLADPRWPEATLLAFQAARLAGIPTLLDAEMGSSRLAELISLTDYCIFAEKALAEFVADKLDLDTTNQHSIWAALNIARAAGVRHAGVTLGARGYRWVSDSEPAGIHAGFVVPVVDTTGAGDAFHGAFAWALAQGFNDALAVHLATAVAAINCTKPGGTAGLPTHQVLEQFLATATTAGQSRAKSFNQ